MTSTTAPAASESARLLLQAPRIQPSDLDTPLKDDEAGILEEFEDAWMEFLTNNPHLIPRGPNTGFEQLQGLVDEAKDVEQAREKVAKELQRQLEFFDSSRAKLEANYNIAMANAATAQRVYHEKMQARLDEVAHADARMSSAIPWEVFLDSLEKTAKENASNILTTPPTATPNKQFKPSAGAMYLASGSSKAEIDNPKDLELRAYRIDHALLNAQIKMLQNEIEKYETSTESLGIVGKVLTEHNVWGALTKPGNNDANSSLPSTPKQKPSLSPPM